MAYESLLLSPQSAVHGALVCGVEPETFQLSRAVAHYRRGLRRSCVAGQGKDHQLLSGRQTVMCRGWKVWRLNIVRQHMLLRSAERDPQSHLARI